MSEQKRVSLGADHAGFEMKEDIKKFLLSQNYEVYDLGTFSSDKADYPDFAKKVCEHIMDHESDYGILICGTGNGMAITANRFSEIRAALCTTEAMAKFARLHNNANILCLGARTTKLKDALKFTEIFLNTDFEGGRHLSRIKKI